MQNQISRCRSGLEDLCDRNLRQHYPFGGNTHTSINELLLVTLKDPVIVEEYVHSDFLLVNKMRATAREDPGVHDFEFIQCFQTCFSEALYFL